MTGTTIVVSVAGLICQSALDAAITITIAVTGGVAITGGVTITSGVTITGGVTITSGVTITVCRSTSVSIAGDFFAVSAGRG
jgi:hypothetical protein